MSILWALTVRELRAFWYSPIAYAVGALFLLLQGLVFWLLVLALSQQWSDPSFTVAQAFLGPTFFSVTSMLIMVPLLTMRTFSEEKRTGSIEFLLTAPVTDAQVVIAKFLGAWLAYGLLWLFTMGFFLLMSRLTTFDWAPIFVGYLGVWLLGAALISLGLLASSLTRNQVIAAVLSFVLLMMLFSVGILDALVRDPDTSRLIRYCSLIEHLRAFSKGVLDTRPVAFYVTFTAICLFLTVRVIGNPRWRS